MSSAVKQEKDYTTCLRLHVYEVPAESEIAKIASRTIIHAVPEDKCLACINERLHDLRHDAELDDLCPIDPDQPNGWALDADDAEKQYEDVRRLYVTEVDHEYRLMPDLS